MSSSEIPNQKDRIEVFRRTLNYLPAFLFSVFGKFPMSPVERNLFIQITNLAAQNVNLEENGNEEKPFRYNLFVVEESDNQSLFKVEPELPIRIASTRPGIHDAILINKVLANDPHYELSLPRVIQILFHEIAWKIPGVTKELMPIIDRLSAQVGKILEQNYQIVQISENERLHLLNSTLREEPPAISIDASDKEQEQLLQKLKIQKYRSGREILIFHEQSSGFVYLPILKKYLLDSIKSIKALSSENVTESISTVNIEQIIIDKSFGKYPHIRFIMDVFERVYQMKKTDETNGDKSAPKEMSFFSPSELSKNGVVTSSEDDTNRLKIEMSVYVESKNNLRVSRRQVLPSDPGFRVRNLKWADQGEFKTGSFIVDIPPNLSKQYMTPDLRAFLWARVELGLAQIEVMRIIPEADHLLIDFKLPSALGTSNAFIVEEVILKNRSQQVFIDLPETLSVKQPLLKKQNFELKTLERKTNENWSLVPVETHVEGSIDRNDSLDKLDKIPGLISITPGPQKIRMHFNSDTKLHEVYFYFRSMAIAHQPYMKMQINELAKNPLGISIVKSLGQSLINKSASHVVVNDDVIHIPASQMKQTLLGSDLIVEFELNLNINPDKGPNTFDTGLRYAAKIIAINQHLDRWRVDGLRHPMFSLEGTSFGLNSCSHFFKK